jgi:hypothetical protein
MGIVGDEAAGVVRLKLSKGPNNLFQITFSIGKTRRTISDAALLVTELWASLIGHEAPDGRVGEVTKLDVA